MYRTVQSVRIYMVKPWPQHTIVVAPMAKMYCVKYHVLIFCLILFDCYALKCRTDEGSKEVELKSIYKKCLKMQEDKSSNSSKESSEHDWSESRGHNHKDNWGRGHTGENKSDGGHENNSKDRMRERNYDNDSRDRTNGRNDDRNGRDMISSRVDNDGKDNMRGKNENAGREERTDTNDRFRYNKQSQRKERDGMMNNNGRYETDNYFNNKDNYPQSDDFGDSMSQYHYHSTTQLPRRYKRGKRPENSGQRSQYNPNSKISGYENYRSDENSNENNNYTKQTDKKACALNCFLQNLEMTAEDGMPDRYLVTQYITKDVKNEDLRDFLQEAIEECFQIISNENTEDKCDFSKDLLVCLSEKGRANCDDWKEELKF